MSPLFCDVTSMPRTEATPEQKEEVRRVIRRAAADVYNLGGQGAVSVRAIAKKAGVSVGTVYRYFGSLHGLYESLWTGPGARLEADMRAIARSVHEPRARLRALMTAYVQFAKENPDIYRGVFMFVRPQDKVAKDRKPATESTFASLMCLAIEEGQAEGQFRPGESHEMAQLIWGGLHGCIALPNNFGTLEFSEPDKTIDQMTEVLLSFLETSS